jgi:hypothetical protein
VKHLLFQSDFLYHHDGSCLALAPIQNRNLPKKQWRSFDTMARFRDTVCFLDGSKTGLISRPGAIGVQAGIV